MKAIVAFIRNTITGGVLFLLPIILFIIIITKANSLIRKLSEPFYEKLPEGFLNVLGSNIITIILILAICFLSGLFFQTNLAKKWVNVLEQKILIGIPGYLLIKSLISSAVGEVDAQTMKPVFIKDGNSWNLAFLVEESKLMSTVFIPDAPRIDAGEIRIVPTDIIHKLDISSTKFNNFIKMYGKGAMDWIK